MTMTRRSLFVSLALALPAVGLTLSNAMAATSPTTPTHKSRMHHTAATSHKSATRHASAHKSHSTHVAQTHHAARKPTKTS